MVNSSFHRVGWGMVMAIKRSTPQDDELDQSVGIAVDPLLDLELRVARRADELARDLPQATQLNLHCWLCAEREVFGAEMGAAR